MNGQYSVYDPNGYFANKYPSLNSMYSPSKTPTANYSKMTDGYTWMSATDFAKKYGTYAADGKNVKPTSGFYALDGKGNVIHKANNTAATFSTVGKAASVMEKSTAGTVNTATNVGTKSSGSGGTGGGGGGGGTGSASATVKPGTGDKPKIYTAAELARMHDINYDYDYILNILNKGTDAYYGEMTEKVKQTQENSLRSQNSTYNQYLDSLRQGRANAVNTGINRGTAAAQELTALLGGQQAAAGVQTELNQNVLDLYNQAITEKARNQESAREKYNTIGSQLTGLSANYNANDVQRYAAELSGWASAYAAEQQRAGMAAQASATRAAASANPQLELLRYMMANQTDPYIVNNYTNVNKAQTAYNSNYAAKLLYDMQGGGR